MALESIALIPSGYKATKVYSQLPVNGNGDFTFDRGTSADQTRVNKNGLIESVAQDVPRLDYLDGGCPSLLLEPASTNLITYSEDFTNAVWTAGAGISSVDANASLSPDGSVNADRINFVLQPDADLGLRFSEVSPVAGDTIAASVYVKGDGTDVGKNVTVRLKRSSGGSFVGDTQDITLTNEWQRVAFKITLVTGNTGVQFIISSNDADTCLVFGAQLEQQSYATSYMPSLLGVQGQRDAETCNGAGTTAEINSQEGVLFVEIRAIADDLSFRRIGITDGSSANRVTLGYTNTSNQIQGVVRNTTDQADLRLSLVDVTNYTKVAIKYSLNDVKFYVNGLLVDAEPSAVMPTGLNELEFNDATTLPFYGRVKKLSVYNDTTQDLEKLTGFTSFAEMAQYLNYA